jgi:hypothetical protein
MASAPPVEAAFEGKRGQHPAGSRPHLRPFFPIFVLRNKKSTEIIVISLDIFVFCAILVHVNQIPESAPGFFQTAITTFSIGFINNMVRRPIK